MNAMGMGPVMQTKERVFASMVGDLLMTCPMLSLQCVKLGYALQVKLGWTFLRRQTLRTDWRNVPMQVFARLLQENAVALQDSKEMRAKELRVPIDVPVTVNVLS